MVNQVLDEALERLRGTGPEIVGDAPNHAPMVAEALVTLGRADAVLPWVDAYRWRLGPSPAPSAPIMADAWREVLGDRSRLGDWEVFFRRELAESAWRSVLAAWVPRLLPGTMAAGTHALIRTAHAVRALDQVETPLRVQELGEGLAYWAAFYQELPGTPRLGGTLDIRRALERIPRLAPDVERHGAPRDVIKLLQTQPDFAVAVDALPSPDSVASGLSALAEAGAELYLANADRYPLVFVHVVTGPAALQLLLPHLPPETRATAFAYVWQAVAAWAAAFGGDHAATHAKQDGAALPSAMTIIERAVDTGDDHAIKFAEAALREYRANPQPVYLTAALDWSTRLLEAKQRSQAERAAAGLAIG